MKGTSVEAPGQHGAAIIRGWARSAGADSAIEYPAIDMQNDSGTDLVEGDVVVVLSDGTIATTTTVADGRPTGVCIDDIDDGDSGPVQFLGPVDLVNVTAAVTAGNYGRTSTTDGAAEEITPATGAFVYFTSSGTEPEGFVIGSGGGGGGGGGGTSPDVPVDHGNMGSTETLDIAAGTWHRGTLNANCAITVSGFTIDEGLVAIFECSQDATGGWDITWDSDVEFIGEDQPDQTPSTLTVFLLFSSAGDSTIYGVRVGGSTGDIEFAGHYELLMDGGSPPEPIEDGSGTDWLYVWVP